GAPPIVRLHFGEGRAHEVGQLEVLEENVENLILAHSELKIVFAFARGRGFLAAAALALRRLFDLIARNEVLVPREHKFAVSTLLRIEPEARLARALGRDADLAVLGDVRDAGILQALLHRLANLRARAAQKALPVGKALAFGIETPVYEVGHAPFRWKGALIPPCSPACTTRRAAGPAAAC